MQSWCEEIKESITNDSSWVPTLKLVSSLWSKDDFPSIIINDNISLSSSSSESNDSISSSQSSPNNDHNHNSNQNEIDVLLLFSNYDHIQNKLQAVSISRNYPSNAIFEFEGYNQLSDKKNLVSSLKKFASLGGTDLVNSSTINKMNDQTNPCYHIILACKHYGKPRMIKGKSIHYFSDNVQASNTLIEQKHSGSSTRGSSRSSKMMRVCGGGNIDRHVSNKCLSHKCGCKFQITIFFHKNTSRWYLLKKKNKNEVCKHTNHIWIDPKFLQTQKRQVNNTIKTDILDMIKSGIPLANISIYVRNKYKINIDQKTIYNFRLDHIKELIDDCSNSPFGSPVDKLVKLFENSKNVSYVYLTHDIQSGFCTHRKNPKEKNKQVIRLDSSNSNSIASYGETIDAWRMSLKLSSTNEILVAFAWAHDDEIRCAEMFPEMIGIDITFGVNKQRRELLVAAGIDGDKKVFTAFRCFIPSKQENTYTWILNEAMSYLLTPKVLMFNACISSDQERALNSAIETSINSPGIAFKNSKLRLDCFHFFRKVWMEKVQTVAIDDYKSNNVIEGLYSWIMSWFKTIESSYEYELSFEKFNLYLEEVKDIIGISSMTQIILISRKIYQSRRYLLNHFFLSTTNFDFLGDSFVEGANHSIKNGPLGVNSKMDISSSGITQVQAANQQGMKRKIDMAKQINKTKTWTRSCTSEYLTTYAEGLACGIFDRKNYYTVKQTDDKTWLVIYSQHLIHAKDSTSIETQPEDKPTFVRVREVSITPDNFMTCSCKYTQRWLMPCTHMCCIINDRELYTPDLFHIRWWKHYNFLYKNSNHSSQVNASNTLKESLINIRDNHYHPSNGKYKGVPLSGSKFLDHHNSNINDEFEIRNDNDTKAMKAIYNMTLFHNKPMIVGNKDFKRYYQNQDSSYEEVDEDIPQISMNPSSSLLENNSASQEPNDLGPRSYVNTNLSQVRTELDSSQPDNTESRTDDESHSAYSTLLPIFSELVATITNQSDIQRCKIALQKLVYDNIQKNNADTGLTILTGQMTFLGESQQRGARIEKRHKSAVENSLR